MLPGDHQQVHRCLGLYVAEGNAAVVFENFVCGDLPPQDFSKNSVVAIAHGS
jgi:hypothetical protein